jgi:hypothetical protein
MRRNRRALLAAKIYDIICRLEAWHMEGGRSAAANVKSEGLRPRRGDFWLSFAKY